MPEPSTLDELPPLTDQGKNALKTLIVYIISLAQQSPDPPFRALFAAYDTVLTEHGIAAEHDQIYFRFLLRMGEGSSAAGDEDLVTRFRKLLAQAGIHIVLGEGEDGVGDITRPIDGLDGAVQERDDAPVPQPRSRAQTLQRKRRVSFNDTNLDSTWLSGGRLGDADGIETRAHSQNTARAVLTGPHRAEHPRDAGPSGAPNTVSRLLAQPPVRGRSTGASAPDLRARSTSTQGSVRIVRDDSRSRYPRYSQSRDQAFNSYGLDQDRQSFLDFSDIPTNVEHAPLDHPSETELLSNADAFRYTAFLRTARRCLHQWHDCALQLYQTRQNLYSIASNYDQQALLRQAIAQWRATLAAKRQAAETDRFFDHMERRAQRARDLFLMTKAFTHWAKSASDELARTGVARRHILRVRYFNAWREITAVNELKCRRLGLRKWFAVWRARTARRLNEEERAVAIHEEKVVERTYWKWFWTFCERKAPVWKDARLKRSAFDGLKGTLRARRDLDDRAMDFRNRKLQYLAMNGMATRLRSIRELENSSSAFRQHALLARSFSTIKADAQLRPKAAQLITSATESSALKAISIWHRNAQLSRQATDADKHRLLRNAWIDWNDKLRTQALAAKIDDRVMLQALYKWILAERLALFQRVMEHRIQRNVLQRLGVSSTDLRFRLNEATMMFHASQDRRRMQSAMLKLHARTRGDEQMEQSALEFRSERLLRRNLAVWQEKTAHVQQLNQWSADARFYCLTMMTLKRWKEATTNIKKVKRRDAYATVRRQVKINAVRRCFNTWHHKSTLVVANEARAAQKYRNRLFVIGTEAFDRLRDKTQQYSDMAVHAAEKDAQRLRVNALQRLVAKANDIRRMDQEAQVLVTASADRLASEKLRVLSRALFTHQRHQETALALKGRHYRKHVRNMLLYWAVQTARRRAYNNVPDPDSPIKIDGDDLFRSLHLPSARKPGPTPASLPRIGENSLGPEDDEQPDYEAIDFSATRRAEEWTQFDILRDSLPSQPQQPQQQGGYALDDSLLGPQHFATPQPGYLRTPSKRTARAKARFKSLNAASGVPSTTPAGPPPATNGFGAFATTTPAPLVSGGVNGMEALTPQITPFERKMRAGGYASTGNAQRVQRTPAAGGGRFGRSLGASAGRSVRFGDEGVGELDGGIMGEEEMEMKMKSS